MLDRRGAKPDIVPRIGLLHARGGLLAKFYRALRVAADVADCGDAARQPDVELVLDRLRLSAALLLQMRVRVDQPRQDVLAAGVDHRVGLYVAAPARTRHRD